MLLIESIYTKLLTHPLKAIYIFKHKTILSKKREGIKNFVQ